MAPSSLRRRDGAGCGHNSSENRVGAVRVANFLCYIVTGLPRVEPMATDVERDMRVGFFAEKEGHLSFRSFDGQTSGNRLGVSVGRGRRASQVSLHAWPPLSISKPADGPQHTDPLRQCRNIMADALAYRVMSRPEQRFQRGVEGIDRHVAKSPRGNRSLEWNSTIGARLRMLPTFPKKISMLPATRLHTGKPDGVLYVYSCSAIVQAIGNDFSQGFHGLCLACTPSEMP